MLNQLVVLVNLIGLFLIDTFLIADISITQNIPATMEAGSEVRVTVTVNKGDLSGFAKLQLDLPPGLSANAIDTKGASFTYADGKAKFIWMALPSGSTFKVTYTLSASSTASGLLPIKGRLSYIENNERKSYEIPEVNVDLGTPGMVADNAPDEEEDPYAHDVVSAAGGAPLGKPRIAVIDNVSGTPPIQGVGGVSGSRIITPLSETEMQVEVTLRKGDIRGFGKLQENIPAGFTAIEQSSEDAIFTAQGPVVKFVWLSLPVKNELKVIYRLRSDSNTHGEYKIDGEFGYLLNDETQRAVIGTSMFFIGQRALDALAADEQRMRTQDQEDPKLTMPEKPKAEPVKPVQPVTPPKEKEQPVAAEPAPKAAPKTAATPAPQPKPTQITGPERGIAYKVQITAAKREVGKPYFVTRHRFHGDFSIERHEGWIKYVTGRFGTYQEARDQRVSFVQAGHNFPGPFVTAYNNGERITVQEALLISNQQWVQ